MISRITPMNFSSKFKTYRHANEPYSNETKVESFCSDNNIKYAKTVYDDGTTIDFEVDDDFDYTVERMLYFNDISYSKTKKFN